VSSSFRVAEAAELLGVSDDTVRRWIDDGRLDAHRGRSGPTTVDGAVLARFATARAETDPDPGGVGQSARNRLTGLVTRVASDSVMSQVEIQAGRFRLVALISTEAVHELGLEPGVLAVASIKATNVVVERPDHP
jgi:molybdopterin-binding protein